MAKAVKRAALKYVTGLLDAFGAVWPVRRPGKTWWKYWFCFRIYYRIIEISTRFIGFNNSND